MDPQTREALGRVAALAPGLLPIGALFGALAVGAGLNPLAAVAMSLIVFAGAAQFAIVGALSQDNPLLLAVVLVLLINSRYLLLTTATLELLRGLAPTRARRLAVSCLVVDESYAIHSASRFTRFMPVIVVSVGLWAVWVTGTALGSLAGIRLEDLERFGFDFALPGIFLGLFSIFMDSPERRAAGAAGFALAAVAALMGLGTAMVVVGAPTMALLAGTLKRGQ